MAKRKARLPTPKKKRPKSIALTAFLGGPGFAKPADIIDPEARLNSTEYPLRAGLGFTGSVFILETRPHTPPWVGFVNQGLLSALPTLTTSGASAVLVVAHSGRLVAFTFGHAGRGMLAAGNYELDFGLKVVLNRVDPKQLRSFDTKHFEDVVITTRKQASRSVELGAFGLDVHRDLVRGVVGEPKDTTYFSRVAGSDAAAFATHLEFSDLGDICDELVDAYQSTDYKKVFDWVDWVKQVRDPVMLQTLDGLLETTIKSAARTNLYLAPAKIVDWVKFEHFSFTGSGKQNTCTYPELSLEGYLDTLGPAKVSALDANSLRRHSVRIKYTNSSEPIDEFTIYECVVWECDHQGQRYVLLDGRWFEIEANYAAKVVAQAKALTRSGAYLINATTGMGEPEYNQRVAASMPDFAFLDRKGIRTSNMASDVECCDFLSPQGEFIHVKRRSGSSTLSHLFSQGSVSATMFIRDQEFRDAIRKKLASMNLHAHAKLVPKGRPDPTQYEVVYAIIAEHDAQGNPPDLQFFSAANLFQHYQNLNQLGFKVSVRYIVAT